MLRREQPRRADRQPTRSRSHVALQRRFRRPESPRHDRCLRSWRHQLGVRPKLCFELPRCLLACGSPETEQGSRHVNRYCCSPRRCRRVSPADRRACQIPHERCLGSYVQGAQRSSPAEGGQALVSRLPDSVIDARQGLSVATAASATVAILGLRHGLSKPWLASGGTVADPAPRAAGCRNRNATPPDVRL